jgi:hypothetical protein
MAVTLTISDTLFARLCEVAEDYEPLPEDFNPYDWCGGNCDDAFYGGITHGSAELANVLLTSNNNHQLRL